MPRDLDRRAGVVRLLSRDPQHAPERLTVFAVERLAGESATYVERLREARPDASDGELAAVVQHRSRGIARTDGAISGTPFFVALVPAYVAMLWEQVRMFLRLAAIHGRDPRDSTLAPDLLVLRGVYPDRKRAARAIANVRDLPKRQKMYGGFWGRVELGHRFAILAGFLDASDPDAPPPSDAKRVALLAVAGVIWALTWVVPLSFMVVMAYSADASTARLAERTTALYGEEGGDLTRTMRRRLRDHTLRDLLAGAALVVSIAVPVGLLVLGVRHDFAIFTWQRALIASAGLSAVLILFSLSRRRA